MAYKSPLHTVDKISPRVQVIETSTLWSGILLKESRGTNRFRDSPDLRRSFAYPSTARTRLRGLSRALWLTILVIILFWWWLEEGKQSIQKGYEILQIDTQPSLDGLQFIAASHPYIHVCYPAHCSPCCS